MLRHIKAHECLCVPCSPGYADTVYDQTALKLTTHRAFYAPQTAARHVITITGVEVASRRLLKAQTLNNTRLAPGF